MTIQENEWNHTAAIVATVVNALSKQPRKVSDFNPITALRKGGAKGETRAPGTLDVKHASIKEAREILQGIEEQRHAR